MILVMNYHVYINGMCLCVTELLSKAQSFLNSMEEEGYAGFIIQINEDEIERVINEEKE